MLRIAISEHSTLSRILRSVLARYCNHSGSAKSPSSTTELLPNKFRRTTVSCVGVPGTCAGGLLLPTLGKPVVSGDRVDGAMSSEVVLPCATASSKGTRVKAKRASSMEGGKQGLSTSAVSGRVVLAGLRGNTKPLSNSDPTIIDAVLASLLRIIG
ncbi:hypothetical protein ABL78_8220 [Leptomonas seymouri]|uniref:Uncharacterized protein n=1 Tax=Leptomonas seymouri TaxID=5684 RepID=A0A0N0P2Q1_LEPSE|nr:hypothetical protein ABL78_8220 [Leptomonas seymouri]|eukprot:KPI82767.1 hypothetical protein ABL78_8220 [Leptomonas seymouri]